MPNSSKGARIEQHSFKIHLLQISVIIPAMTKADVLVVSKSTTLLLDDAEAFIIRLVVARLDWFLLLLFS
jgi:hypothetical protein